MATDSNLKPGNNLQTMLAVFVLAGVVSYFTAAHVSKTYLEEQAELQKKTALSEKIPNMVAELEKHPLTKSAFEPISPPKLALPQIIEGLPKRTTFKIAAGEMIQARITTVWRMTDHATLVRAVVDKGSHRGEVLLGSVMAELKTIADKDPVTVKFDSITIGKTSANVDAYAVTNYGYIKNLRNKGSQTNGAIHEVIFTSSVQGTY